MGKQSISQPSAQTYTVVDLVASAVEGRIRIPDFQRPLRWQWEDVRRLFDSIVKGYPIGNLLLWKRMAPAETIKLGALHIEAKQFDEGWWVVDGQQRLISLANVLSEEGMHDERFALAYDLHDEIFVRPSRQEEGHIVPLPVLFDLQRLIRWFSKEHPEASESLDKASMVTRAIREYQIPAYLVVQDDEEILRDIFDRLNSYGKRLNKAEVFSALYPLERSDTEPSYRFQAIAENIHGERFFGIIDEITVMKALLARRGPNVKREIRIEFSAERTREPRDFANESQTDFYNKGMDALLRTVKFLQEDANVPHFYFLPYRYLLVVLTRFFSHFPEPKPRNRNLLRRWFWRAALTGPGVFDGNWDKAARTLSACIKANDEDNSLQRLLDKSSAANFLTPKLIDFRPHWAEGRIILSALWYHSPRSPLTGQPYDRQQLADAIGSDSSLRAVLPKILLSEPQHHRYWVANRILVLEEEVRDDSIAETINIYRSGLTSNWPIFLDSHAMNEELMLTLTQGDKVHFLEGRQKLIHQVVEHFIQCMTEAQLEDTPPLDSFDLDEMDEERDDALT